MYSPTIVLLRVKPGMPSIHLGVTVALDQLPMSGPTKSSKDEFTGKKKLPLKDWRRDGLTLVHTYTNINNHILLTEADPSTFIYPYLIDVDITG